MTELEHDLAPHFAALRAIETRAQLLASPLWAEIGPRVEQLLDGLVVRENICEPVLPRTFRAGAWNIQRGKNLDGLIAAIRSDPELARVDVWMLSEVDCGMGRSGNRDVARELAQALGMGYAFAVSYLVLEDDFGENAAQLPSTLGLAGSAILSRAPIIRAVNVDVPALRDKFSSKSEKRLGRKRAVVAQVATETGTVVLAQAHLDSNADAAGRARQLAAIVDAADGLAAEYDVPVLLGGDLNTTTYQYSSTWRLARDLLHKLFVTGFAGTVNNYLTPERRYETPIFELLAARGLTVDGWNARGGGTMRYDLNEPYAVQKVENAVGGLLTRWLRRRLRPWHGVVAAHLDWFAGRGLTPSAPVIVRAPGSPSDHDAILVDVTVRHRAG